MAESYNSHLNEAYKAFENNSSITGIRDKKITTDEHERIEFQKEDPDDAELYELCVKIERQLNEASNELEINTKFRADEQERLEFKKEDKDDVSLYYLVEKIESQIALLSELLPPEAVCRFFQKKTYNYHYTTAEQLNEVPEQHLPNTN